MKPDIWMRYIRKLIYSSIPFPSHTMDEMEDDAIFEHCLTMKKHSKAMLKIYAVKYLWCIWGNVYEKWVIIYNNVENNKN